VRLLVLHGLFGNERQHWQTWLAEQAAAAGVDVRYPDLPEADAPTADGWLAAVRPLLGLSEDLLVAAHSLGCHLWAHLSDRERRRLAHRVVLVAPPGGSEVREEIPSFVPAAWDGDVLRRACPDTTVVLGEADDWLADPAPVLATGLPVRVVRGGAHLSVPAGFGPWPAMLGWLRGGPAPGEPVR
jgi:hypothetical protein